MSDKEVPLKIDNVVVGVATVKVSEVDGIADVEFKFNEDEAGQKASAIFHRGSLRGVSVSPDGIGKIDAHPFYNKEK